MVDRVERSIKEAEEKVRKRVEEERKRVEEEKRKEDEERKKEEEERKKQVEKRRKEQEQQAQEAKERMEAEEKKKVAEIETKKKEEEEEKIKKLHENTKAITGFESARDDWVSARTTLKVFSSILLSFASRAHVSSASSGAQGRPHQALEVSSRDEENLGQIPPNDHSQDRPAHQRRAIYSTNRECAFLFARNPC